MIKRNNLSLTSSKTSSGNHVKETMYSITKLRSSIFIFLLLFTTFSCQEILDVKPDDKLQPGDFYRNRFDADAAVIGVYGKFMGLAERYVVLNELRADLMDVTANADANLRDLNEHNVGEGNKYADIEPFYEVILLCNDVLKNFDIMKASNKLSIEEYNERYSDIATLRSWIYLQVVTHWGNVPYITEPFESANEIKNLSTLPKLSIDQMVEELINVMTNLPSKEMYASTSTLRATIDGYNPLTMFINKKSFLGDLYLWRGKIEDFEQAARNYKDVMMTPVPGVNFWDSYRVRFADVSTNNDITISYIRYKGQDYYSLIDNNTQGWKSLFIDAPADRFNSEWIWTLPFDSQFKQGTPFVNLFANSGEGKYLLKPSQLAINLWNSQTQQNGFPWDQRGRFTYAIEGGQPVIKKYTYKYDNLLTPLKKDGKWFLNRAALIHLRFAEAACRDDKNDNKKYKVAWALLNAGGFKTWYDDPKIATRNMKDKRATFLDFPYDFDARQSDPPDGPSYRDNWHRHEGIRGRAYVTSLTLDSVKYFNMTTKAVTNSEGLKRDIEDKLVAEAALELAYEGHRWHDLVRIAKRRNDPSFLANKIADKLAAAGNPNAETVRAKLMDMNNWFLPFPSAE